MTSNMKPTKALKSKIKKKFGTYSNFTRIAGIDRYEFQRDFLCKEKVQDNLHNDIAFAYDKFDNKLKGEEVTESMREWIETSVKENNGVIAFCREHGFSKNTVFQVISGYYKVVTPNIKRLIDKLKELEQSR